MSKSCGGACGGDATSAADTDIQASSEAPGRWVSVYAVPKMDCPSEERMIRLALNGFEVMRARMLYTTKHKKKAPTAKVSPFYKKTIGYGLPDFAEELNYGVDLSTILGWYQIDGVKVPHQPLNPYTLNYIQKCDPDHLL